MLEDFLAAFALVLVIEGLIPFIFPAGARKAWLTLATANNRSLRWMGLISMILGVLLLYWVR